MFIYVPLFADIISNNFEDKEIVLKNLWLAFHQGQFKTFMNF